MKNPDPPSWLIPDWRVPATVAALVTPRAGGVSEGSFGTCDGRAGGLNLGEHVGDDPERVRRNRELLQRVLPGPVRWLEQVHGAAVHDADTAAPDRPPRADAAVTTRPGQVLAVMSADCLPILFADSRGRCVGVAHAGWRGLAAGVAEATVTEIRRRCGGDAAIVAWLGPAIGPSAFEVGDDVHAAFCHGDADAEAAFKAGPAPGKWFCDLYRLARLRLARVDVDQVGGGGRCTVREPAHFYSHRRDRCSGRFASLVWLRA